MDTELTNAEKKAAEASTFGPFSTQIHEVRRVVNEIANLFGKNKFFSQYTVHDYRHINSMLKSLDWIIPEPAWSILTHADWMLITLSIYFHDLGLVITEEEYANRNNSDFPSFCRERLFKGVDGQDYKIKIETSLGQDNAERFFYQEFVRHNHGARVRAWIEGSAETFLGCGAKQVAEVSKLLHGLKPSFRRDLAMICESHNLDDLTNEKKYPTMKPYGGDVAESGNLLYAAIVLRTADLLQVTDQRAPAITYRLLNPTDPISQAEWLKQKSVTAVFPQTVKDADGTVVAGEQSSIIDIHAEFEEPTGYFGLTTYLRYARTQLAESYKLMEKGNASSDRKYPFPWKGISEDHIEVMGFLKSQISFNIDQRKVLDLLTGHTLYNDSTVAVRELVQNALDAVKLQKTRVAEADKYQGCVTIHWESLKRELSISDNGTGMTHQVILNHFLNVGSSLYPDSKFVEDNPNFSSISRFGIGVLSAFMVADNVEVDTFSNDDEEGRNISLRSVHGSYLMRLLDKRSSEEVKVIGTTGTRLRIKLRASAKNMDIKRILQHWILFPDCKVIYIEDDKVPAVIGFESPRKAVEEFIKENGVFSDTETFKIVDYVEDGISLAFALRYNSHYREYNFAHFPPAVPVAGAFAIGLCVEGVRVEIESPGMLGSNRFLLSVVNCTGKKAPKTNVSRSALENDERRADVHQRVYGFYLASVQSEIDRLQSEEKYSLAYAVNQFPFLGGALYSQRSPIEAKYGSLKEFKLLLVENDKGRYAESTANLLSLGFWSVEPHAISAKNDLLKEADASITARRLLEVCKYNGIKLPDGILITGLKQASIAASIISHYFDVTEVRGSLADRRLDARWQAQENGKAIWYDSTLAARQLSAELQHEITQFRQVYDESRGRRFVSLAVCLRDLKFEGLDNYIGAKVLGVALLHPETAISKFIKNLNLESTNGRMQFLLYSVALTPVISGSFEQRGASIDQSEVLLKEVIARWGARYPLDHVGFTSAVLADAGRMAMYEPLGWMRGESNAPEFGF